MLELYQLEECPFCSRVRSKLSDLNLDYIARAVPRDRALREKVEEVSGQRSVPVLVDPEGGKVVTDSERIIEYLLGKFG
jgi:glutathione S-transferase